MVRAYIKVIAADLVLLAALLWILQDLQWRTWYAASPHAGTTGYTPSFSYSVLTQFFTMAGSGVSLTSPPTLDWVQFLAYVLVALNAWFAYQILRHRRAQPLRATQPDSP